MNKLYSAVQYSIYVDKTNIFAGFKNFENEILRPKVDYTWK